MEGNASIGGTITTGIQDISALLPLLGTEQCEQHIGSALADGFLYAAATPLSIFGSLGMARAGFKALVASISIPTWRIVGAEKLLHAGFTPTGKNLSLIMMDPDHTERHLAETRLDVLLEELHIEDVEKVTVKTTCATWNIKMVLATALLCFLGLTPYIHLNLTSNTLPRSTGWTFPVIRVLGGFLTATSTQILTQRRLVAILNHRLSFHVLDATARSRSHFFQWDSKTSSEVCLWSLQCYLEGSAALSLRQRVRRIFGTKLDAIRQWLNLSFNCQRPDEENPRREDAVTAEEKRGSDALQDLKSKFGERVTVHQIAWPFMISNAIGICASVIGYVGCFSVVQGAQSHKGPVIWLCLEAILSIFRMALWGLNPNSDVLDHIKLTLDLAPHPPMLTCHKTVDEIRDGKNLPLVQAPVFLSSITSYAGLLKRFDSPSLSLFYTLTRDKVNLGTRALFIAVLDNSERTTRVYGPGDKESSELEFWSADVITTQYGLLQTNLTGIIDPLDDPVMGDHAIRDAFIQHYHSILAHLRYRDEGRGDQDEVDSLWTLKLGEENSLISRLLAPGTAQDEKTSHGKAVPSNELDAEYLLQGGLQREKINLSDQRLAWLDLYMEYVRSERKTHLDELISGLTCGNDGKFRILSQSHLDDLEYENDWGLMCEWFELHNIVLEEMDEWERRLAVSYKAMISNNLAKRGLARDGSELERRLQREWEGNAQTRHSSLLTRITEMLNNNRKNFEWRDLKMADEWSARAHSLLHKWNLPINTMERVRYSRWEYFVEGKKGLSRGRESKATAFLNQATGDMNREAHRRIRNEVDDAIYRFAAGLDSADAKRINVHSDTQGVVVALTHGRLKWTHILHTLETTFATHIIRALQRNGQLVFASFFFYDYSLAADKYLAKTLKSIQTPPVTSIRVEVDNLGPTSLAVLEDMAGLGCRNLDVNVVRQPSIQETLAQLRHDYVPNRFTTFSFHRFEVVDPWDNIHLHGVQSSEIEIKFVGPANDALMLRLYHRSHFETRQQLEVCLGAGDRSPITVLVPSTQSPTTSKIWLTPGHHFDSGILNSIFVRPLFDDYFLYNIDLVDERGDAYWYEGGELEVMADDTVNQDRDGDIEIS